MVAIPENTRTTIHAINDAWEAREADQPKRAHLGASQVGRACAREIWYSFRWALHRIPEGRMLRLFNRGHREETSLIESLRLAGATVHDVDPRTGEQFQWSAHGGHIGGSMDGCALGLIEAPKTWHCLEFKTASDKYFKMLQRDGVEKSKPEHFAQMQLYMLWSGMDRAYYLAVNKNDDQLYSERIRFDRSRAEHYLNQAKTIVDSAEPPQRLSSDPTWWQCRFCDFHALCHGDKVADANCRTCVHITPMPERAETINEPKWWCTHHKLEVPFRGQCLGCPQHRFIPALMPLGKPVDGDQDANWVEYERDGQRFRNGEAGDMSFTSKELSTMVVSDLTNTSVLELRKMFDGRFVKDEAA